MISTILTIWFLLAISFTIAQIFTIDEADNFLVPDIIQLHDETEMNWFGCVLSALVIFVINPIISIFWIIYWICHVGRKD